MIEEIKLIQKAGYSIEESVNSDSYNGAHLLDLNVLGLLKNHVPASFLIVDGGPTSLPESLENISSVILDGRRIYTRS